MDNMTAKKLFGLICAEYKRTQKPVPRSYVREKCGGDAGLMESLVEELILIGSIAPTVAGYAVTTIRLSKKSK